MDDPARPLCPICQKRHVDKFKTSQGETYRKNCSSCRRNPNHEKLRYQATKQSRATAVDHIRPKCKLCNKNLCRLQSSKFGLKANGTPYYHSDCSTCAKRKRVANGGIETYWVGYRRILLRTRMPNLSCDYCGFEPLHPGQLDVDHIDGNHHNHEMSNLQLLCANCHRLKTILNRDHVKNSDLRWEEYREHASKPNENLVMA